MLESWLGGGNVEVRDASEPRFPAVLSQATLLPSQLTARCSFRKCKMLDLYDIKNATGASGVTKTEHGT